MVPPTRRRFGERLSEFHEAQEEDAREFRNLIGAFLPSTFPAIVAILVLVGGALVALGTGFYVAAALLIAGVGLTVLWRRRHRAH
jgi:hypothetical protein